MMESKGQKDLLKNCSQVVLIIFYLFFLCFKKGIKPHKKLISK